MIGICRSFLFWAHANVKSGRPARRRAPERVNAGVLELRRSRELNLRHVEDCVVRIGTRDIRVLAAGASGSHCHRRNGGAGCCNGLIGPGDLAIGYRNVVLTQTEEATRTDHNGFDLSGLIDDEFGDVPDLPGWRYRRSARQAWRRAIDLGPRGSSSSSR